MSSSRWVAGARLVSGLRTRPCDVQANRCPSALQPRLLLLLPGAQPSRRDVTTGDPLPPSAQRVSKRLHPPNGVWQPLVDAAEQPGHADSHPDSVPTYRAVLVSRSN